MEIYNDLLNKIMIILKNLKKDFIIRRLSFKIMFWIIKSCLKINISKLIRIINLKLSFLVFCKYYI